MPKLPPDYQPLANARLAMATRAADAATLLRDVPAAKLAEPAIKLEQLAWLRRTGKLTEAKALALQPPPTQTEAWWNERQQLARDLLAAGHPAEAYAVTVPHGQTKGVAFAEAEFLAGWIALRRLKKTADGLKHFQTLYDGASTDTPGAAAPTGSAARTRPRDIPRRRWTGSAAPPPSARPSTASSRRGACRAARGRCRAIPRRRPPSRRRWPAASWSRWPAISARPANRSARGPSCCGWRAR